MRIACCTLNGLSGPDAGRRLLAQLYRAETRRNFPDILTTDRGKPFFAEGKLHFSISHTPHHAFCVLAEYNVAVDAEELDRDINLKLADKVLSPGERRQLDAATDKRRALLTFWVLKEASVKLTGEGLRGYPNHTDFSLDDPRVQEIDGCLVAVLKEGE